MFKRPSDGFWAGLFVGIVSVTLLMAFHVNPNTSNSKDVQPVFTSNAAATSFVNSWQRMAEGTWAVQSTFVRTLSSGRTFQSDVFEAQTSTHYLRRSSNSVSARVNGRAYSCAANLAGKVTTCQDGGAAPTNKEVAAQQVDSVKALVAGNQRVYDVARSSSQCYTLYSRGTTTATLPWGSQAKFCFDSTSGAMTLSELHRDEGVDVTTATKVDDVPASNAFELPHG